MSGRCGDRSGDLVIAKNAASVRRPDRRDFVVGTAPDGFRPKLNGMPNAFSQGMDRKELERRSQAFAVRAIALCGETRKTPGWRSIADQLQDAATSSAANYRASARARSRAEFVAKLGIVNEESDETVFWLELMRDSGVGDRRQVGLLLPEAVELRAIFAASYRTANAAATGVRVDPTITR